MWPSEKNYYKYTRENISKRNYDIRNIMEISRICSENLLNSSSIGNISTASYLADNNTNVPSECPIFWNETTFVYNNSIEESSADNLEHNATLKLGLAVPMGIFMYMLSLVTVVGNAMVLHAIRTERRLQTVSNMFIMSLAAADITVGGIVMPISSVYAITGQWVFGLAVCQFWLSADYTASTASILNLFILSMDRYWSITSPLRYLRRRTKKRALIMIGLVWAGSALWILPIIGWHYIESGGKRMYPATVCETEFASNVAFKVTAACLNFYIPTLLMVYLYGRIFFEIKKRSRFDLGQCNHSSRIEIGSGILWGTDSLVDDHPPNHLRNKSRTFRKKNAVVGETHQFRNLTVFSYKSEGTQSEGLVHFEGVTVNVEYVEIATTAMDVKHTDGHNIHENSSGSQYRRTFAHRPAAKRRSNDSDSVILQKEKKAARQLGVIMSAFVLCWLPYFVLFMVIAFCSDCVNPVVHTASIWLGYINSTLNPILYPLCNTNFKRAFKKMLGFGSKDRNALMLTNSRGGGGQPNHLQRTVNNDQYFHCN